MMPLAIGLLPAATGFLLIRALTDGSVRSCRHDVFRIVLGTGIGIGLASECYFLGLVTGTPGLLLEILLLLAAATGVARNRKAQCRFCDACSSGTGGDRPLTLCLSWAFALLLFLDLAV